MNKSNIRKNRDLTRVLLSRRIIPVILALLLSFSGTVQAGKYKLIYEDKKSGYSIADTSGVCQAYEKNLNKFQHIPYGMACERKLDPSLGFTRPKWKRLDPINHTELIREIYKTRKSKPDFIEDPIKWSNYIKSEVDRGSLTLEVTRIDTGNVGSVANFVKIGTNKKCNDVKRFNSMGSPNMEKIFRVNYDLKHLASIPEIGYGKDNLILYQGRIYADHYYGFPVEAKIHMGRDATLELYIVRPNRIGRLCKYYYYEK